MSAPSGEPQRRRHVPEEATPAGGGGRLLAGPAARVPALLAAAGAVACLDRLVIAALVESVRADLWLTDARLGLLMAGFALAHALPSPALLRWWGDRPPRLLLALGVGLWSAATVLSGLALGFASLLAARVAVGLGQAAYGAAAPAVAAGHLGRARRRAEGQLAAGAVVGAALAYALGGLADRALGWRVAFAAAGAPGLVLAALWLRLAAPAAAAGPGRAGRGRPAAPLRLRQSRTRALAAAGQAAHAFAAAALAFWLPAFLERARGVPRVIAAAEVGALVAMAGFGGAFLGRRLVRALRRRLREPGLWISGLASLAAAALSLAVFTAARPALYLAALAGTLLLVFAAGASAGAARAARAAPEERDRTAASPLAVELLGAVPAAAVVGAVSDHGSLGRAMLLVPLALLAAAVASTLAARRGAREAQAAERRAPGE